MSSSHTTDPAQLDADALFARLPPTRLRHAVGVNR